MSTEVNQSRDIDLGDVLYIQKAKMIIINIYFELSDVATSETLTLDTDTLVQQTL